MYKIGELSRLCSIPVKTLRYYDDIGLLPADVIDKYTGYRYYTPARLADCYQILALKELGFSLEQIREHLSSGDTTAILERRKAELRATIADVTEKLHRLETLQQLQKGEKSMIPMVIRKAEPITVAYRRQVYHDREEALQMCKAMAEKLDGGRQVLIDYEMSYRTENVDMAVCVVVKGKTNEATMTILDGEDYAAIVCTREKLEEGYGDLIQQIHAYPAQIIGPSYEIELDGQELVELRVPICILTPDKVFPCDRLPESFTDDPDVIGKWGMLDRVPSKEQFLYGHEKSLHLGWLDELYFLPDGKPYWTILGWTQGKLYLYGPKPQQCLANEYEIVRENGHTLLYLYMKNYRDGQGRTSGVPEVWVYEKVDSIPRKPEELCRIDRTDYPFVPDEDVLGLWHVRDFYNWKIEENFDPNKQNFPKEDLFVQEMQFFPDGQCIQTTKNRTRHLRYVGATDDRPGYVLNEAVGTASAYTIREVDGKAYLIVEWKTGDYQYGSDARVYWYVFVR